MARQFTRTIRGVPRSVRQNTWININLVETVVAGSASVLLVSLNAAALALRPFTVVRSRMLIQFDSDQGAATETPHAAFGEIVVSEQASAQGALSIPNPISDADAPWFVWQPLLSHIDFFSAASVIDVSRHFTVDSKSMRKVGINEDIVGQIQTGSADGVSISIVGRHLLKLH